MGFWDFFKRKNKEKKETEKVKVEELESWLLNKKNEIEKQEEDFLNLIQERINQLIQELEEKISALKKINVNEKKAEEKIKLIVKENLDNYVSHLEELIDELKGINKEKNIIEKINSIFSDFEKKSRISFEKATFLIGKEMANVKDSIRNFFRGLEKILKENKELIDKLEVLHLVEIRIEKINEIKKIIKDYDDKINNLREAIEFKEKEIEEIKKSEKFIEEKREEQEFVRKKEELEKELYNLREMIDFKSLANFFHSFQKEMSIVKAYKEDFKNSFQRTDGEDILSLLKEAKLQNAIVKKIEEIIEKKKKLDNIIIEKTETVEDEIRKTEAEINFLSSKKFVEEKKYRKIELNFQEIINLIKQDLTKINVEVG